MGQLPDCLTIGGVCCAVYRLALLAPCEGRCAAALSPHALEYVQQPRYLVILMYMQAPKSPLKLQAHAPSSSPKALHSKPAKLSVPHQQPHQPGQRQQQHLLQAQPKSLQTQTLSPQHRFRGLAGSSQRLFQLQHLKQLQ